MKREDKGYFLLRYRYDATMEWAIASTHLSEALAVKAQKRLAPLMRKGTEFSIF